MSAEDVLRWAYEEFGDRLCLTCSWQKQSSALVHMVSELGLDLPIIELDTHLFFRESYETRDRLVERYGLSLQPPPKVITVAEQHRAEGPNLWETDPDRCCHIRKVEPLLDALEPYGAWISGIRRDQSPSRATTPKVQWSERYGVWKLHPLADWDEKRVWAYITVNEIPYNPLHDVGLPLDRLHSLHPADEPRGRGAGRPLGGLRQARVRHSRRNPTRRHMSDHIYAAEHPETTHVRPGGFTLWFTGLSGSGKTTIAHLVGPELDRRGLVVEYLDGDTVRTHLSKGLGFSKEDRDTHIERVGWVASRLTRQGGAVIAATISPYEATRQEARERIDEVGTFVEIYVKTSVDECAKRDVKGLYEKAFKGEIKEFTGVSDPYEEPSSPELVIDTEQHEPEESAALVVAKLEELDLIPSGVTA